MGHFGGVVLEFVLGGLELKRSSVELVLKGVDFLVHLGNLLESNDKLLGFRYQLSYMVLELGDFL